MQKIRKGFTLAEVLVTLAIIGVIAALTIPALIQNINTQKYQTGLKKEISVLNQAISAAIMNYSTDPTSATNATTLASFFANNLNVIKTGTGSSAGVLWLADGSKILFIWNSTCTTASLSTPTSIATPLTLPCAAIIDVNGDKLPNSVATVSTPSDVYIVGITPTSVLPVGGVSASFATPAAFKFDANGTALTYTDAAAGPGNAALNAITGGST